MSDRYDILGKLARGGIGAIYRANDTVMGRVVAIKRLLPIEETHLNESADESLEREAAALARFQHPNVVTIYAFESDDEGSYVVMELIDGENLKETIERGALPLDDFENLVLQTLDPLISAKDMNLMHRDIKPSNIMLTWLTSGRFQVKVLDFGLAKFSQLPSTQTLDQTGSFLGSIDYLAPEQLELAPLDQRTDLYSLGCVLYYCLTQRPPFEGKNSAETMQNHLKHKVAPLREFRADVPKPIADWVMRMISRYPNQRPDDARVALREFEAALTGVSPVAAEEASRPVVEVVEELPVAQLAEIPTTEVSQESLKHPEEHDPDLASTTLQQVQRPKLNTLPASAPPKKKASSKAFVPEKKPGTQLRELKIPLIALGLSIVAAVVVLIVLLKKGSGEDPDSPSDTGKKSSPAKAGGSPKGAKSAEKNAAQSAAVWAIRNPSGPAKTEPPPVTEGLVAHFTAGERCFGGGNDFKNPAGMRQRIKAWGNIAPGAGADHLMTVDPGNLDNGPQLKNATPQNHPELNGPHAVLAFRNVDRLISRDSTEIREKLTGTELTSFFVLRTESPGGQILRLMGTQKTSRILKLGISGKGAKYKTTMSRGTLRPAIETELGEGKGKFLIFSHIWSGDEFGEQRHHLYLSGEKRKTGKPGDAPHMKQRQSPVRYALGATDPTTAEEAGVDGKGKPRKEGVGGFKGDLAEWLIYNRVLSDDERTKVEDYLYRRYFEK